LTYYKIILLIMLIASCAPHKALDNNFMYSDSYDIYITELNKLTRIDKSVINSIINNLENKKYELIVYELKEMKNNKYYKNKFYDDYFILGQVCVHWMVKDGERIKAFQLLEVIEKEDTIYSEKYYKKKAILAGSIESSKEVPISILNTALLYYPQSSRISYLLGTYHYMDNSYKIAVKYLERSLQNGDISFLSDKKSAAVFYSTYGTSMLEIGDTLKTLNILRVAFMSTGNTYFLYGFTGLARNPSVEKKYHNEIYKYYNLLRDYTADTSRVLLNEGLANVECKYYNNCKKSIELILDSTEIVADKIKYEEYRHIVYHWLSWYYYKIGEYDSAIDWVQEAIRESSIDKKVNIENYLGLYYLFNGDYINAYNYLKLDKLYNENNKLNYEIIDELKKYLVYRCEDEYIKNIIEKSDCDK